jgi:hypothetical protein
VNRERKDLHIMGISATYSPRGLYHAVLVHRSINNGYRQRRNRHEDDIERESFFRFAN